MAQRFASDQPSEYEGLVFRASTYQDYIIGNDASKWLRDRFEEREL